MSESNSSGTVKLICGVCLETFEHPKQRGRRPHMCPSCREAETREKETPKEKPSSTDVVDRLEMMLRSRGTHISQQ